MGYTEHLAAMRAEVHVPPTERTTQLLVVNVREFPLAIWADRLDVFPLCHFHHRRLPTDRLVVGLTGAEMAAGQLPRDTAGPIAGKPTSAGLTDEQGGVPTIEPGHAPPVGF